MTIRISQSIKLGPFRFRLSLPVGRGRPRVSASVPDGIGRFGVSTPVGRGRRRRRG